MALLKDYIQFIKCKDLYLRFCHNLCKDPTVYHTSTDFLNIHKTVMAAEPELTDYIYQSAMQAVFYKKRVPDFDLENFFNNRFKIRDPYHLNEGLSDISTINSMFIMNHITEKVMFRKNNIEIFSTPFVYQTKEYYSRQKTCAKNYVEESKNVTNNTNADIRIDHRIYDIKHTTDTRVTKNHIYPWIYERIEKDTQGYLNNLYENLIIRPDNSKIHKNLLQKLKDIKEDKTLTMSEKNNQWNHFIEKNFHKLSPEYTLPLIIQMTNYPYRPKLAKKQLDNFHASPDVVDDAYKGRRAITGACLGFGPQYLKNASIVSEGTISATLLQENINNHEID